MSVAAIKRGYIPECNSLEAKQKRADTIKQNNPMKKRWEDPEYRNRMLIHLKELNQSPEHKVSSAKGSRILRETHPDIIQNFLKKGHDLMRTPEGRALVSEGAKRQWQRMKPEMIKAQRQGMKEPNKVETRLLYILEKNFPGHWRYVGNGKVIIQNIVPDFINTNGRKEVIELFGDYWHSEERRGKYGSEIVRREIFEQYGYRLLVIWEKEVKKLTELEIVDKIKKWEESIC